MKLMIVGDVHANFAHMEDGIGLALAQHGPFDKIVQVGDFGYFPSFIHRFFQSFDAPQWFIRGNHEEHDALPIDEVAIGPMDTPCGEWKFVGDGWVDDDEILYIGGAWSIDRAYRQTHGPMRPGFIDHWRPTEQMSEATIDRLERELAGQTFRAIVTHEAPEFLFPQLVTSRVEEPNRTAEFLDRLFMSTTTPVWCFGHHHRSRHMASNGTQFYCTDMVGGSSPFIRILEL